MLTYPFVSRQATQHGSPHPSFIMRFLNYPLLALLTLSTVACGQNPGKTGAKKRPKAEVLSLSKNELPFVGEWKVTRYFVPGGEYEFEDKDLFLTLRKDGSVACKFPLDEKENPQIHKAEGTGMWKLQFPKPKIWQGPIEGVEKGFKYKITDKEEVLVLALKGASGVKELKFLVSKSDGKLLISLPAYYFSIEALAK